MKRKIIIAAAFCILLLIGIAKWQSSKPAGANAVKTSTDTPLKSVTLNKEFNFPMLNTSGAEITRINYNIQSAELRDTIVLRGERATAAPGRVFLIFNLKLRNDSSQRLQLNTGDYVRLSVNDADEWLAPDIHNDPVEVAPISTKQTRVGFVVSLTDKNFRLRIGEINGEKTTVPVTF